MAAFTTFSEEALARYLVMFGRGELERCEPIDAGIENSNYFITLAQDGTSSEYVLTIVEDMTFAEVPFFNKLITRLSHYGLPVPAPLATLDGMTSTIFCGKPAMLVPRLPGMHLERVDENHCRKIGEFIASCHHALGEFQADRDNPYNPEWMASTREAVNQRLDDDDRDLLDSLIEAYRELADAPLPRGFIHGDLFIDNALFHEGELSGVIDFYHACHDLLIQDLAIALNDWCLDATGQPDAQLEAAMLSGYESMRELSDDEKAALLPVRQISAARFALTRLLSGDPPLKDPAHMFALARSLAAL